ncbi:hypothetical protein Noca_3808 [Nocardioides sp. JS614]|nr:hypothetical protein Noca_3808 [Nocardioides sp. JS614]
MAGESAEQLARRQRERAERLLRSAQMYERGAHGERATATILDALRHEGWAVFHDVKWPGRPRANIDHVVVGPPGIYVIDSKNWSGRIDVRDNTFRCDGRKQDKIVAAAGDAALAVAGLVSAPAAATARSVLCFVREEHLAGWCYDVMVCSTGNLREMLLTRPPALTVDQARMAGLELDIAFRAAAQSTVPASAARPVGRRPMPTPRVTAPPPRRHSPKSRKRHGLQRQLFGLLLVVVVAMVGLTQLPRLASLSDDVAKAIVPQPAVSYDSCKELRGVYPNGVGTTAGVDSLHRKQLPVVDMAVYAANRALDTDHDWIACERGQDRPSSGGR